MLLQAGAAALAGIALASRAAEPPASAASLGAGGALPANGPLGYAFGTRFQDVTIFDPVTFQALATMPLGVTVRWLSNAQTFWDGRLIWTYDFPNNEVQAVAIDPLTPAVAARIPTGGKGPAHSLMLTPDRRTAWLNLAGDDQLAVVDLATQQVIDKVSTGHFP